MEKDKPGQLQDDCKSVSETLDKANKKIKNQKQQLKLLKEEEKALDSKLKCLGFFEEYAKLTFPHLQLLQKH